MVRTSGGDFLFISGATGALISWDHKLDGWLNPQLFYVKSGDLDAKDGSPAGVAFLVQVALAIYFCRPNSRCTQGVFLG